MNPDDRYVDFPELFKSDVGGADWLYPEVLARGRGHSLYAKAKEGKSLFVLFVAAQLAVDRDDVDVFYFDYEMTPGDLKDRLLDMGYGPEHNFSRLHYAQLPSLPALDSPAGAKELYEWIAEVWDSDRELVVVIDTISRAVDGEENSNDTIQNFYRYTGRMLKKLEATWIRLDHAGKDFKKGMRGGSAKNDDVDIVWSLKSVGRTTLLSRDLSRVSWVPDEVTFNRVSEPSLAFTSTTEATCPSPEALDVIKRLEQHDVPVEVTVRMAEKALRAAEGAAASRTVMAEAVRLRKAGTAGSGGGTAGAGTTGGTTAALTALTSTGTASEPSGTTESVHSGTGSPPWGEPVPRPEEEPSSNIDWDAIFLMLEETP